jgi:hypothetical protein
LQTGCDTLRHNLFQRALYRKCGEKEEFSYNTHQFPSLAKHGIEIFGSTWLNLMDIRRVSVRMVLAVALQSELLVGP